MSKKVKRTPSEEEKPPAARKPGRPTKYSLEIGNAYCELVRNGMGLDDACYLVGINPKTRAAWEAVNVGFLEAVKSAQSKFIQDQLTVIREASVNRYDREGRLTRRGSWQAASWLLERKFADQFGMKWQGELSGKGGKPLVPDSPKVDLSKFTDEQLRILGSNLAPIINGGAAPAAANGNGNGSPG